MESDEREVNDIFGFIMGYNGETGARQRKPKRQLQFL